MTKFAAGFFFLHLLRSKTETIIFKKLSVRVIDITFEGEGGGASRRLNQLRVHQFSKYFVSWANQKPEFLSVSVSFQSFIASLDIV